MRRSLNMVLTAAAAFILGASALAWQAETTVAANAPASDGLAAWAKLHEVLSHPRCTNCHVADGRPMWSGPSYGEARVHGMNVGGDPDMLFGNPGLMCNTCHMAENSAAHHGPPGAEVWHLPPAEMAWWKESSAAICAQLKDPARNGGRSLADIETHIAEDALVAWGWRPGPGREPAPYSASEAAAFVAAWAADDAPCPGE